MVPCLRLLTALEDVLGSLGPTVNQVTTDPPPPSSTLKQSTGLHYCPFLHQVLARALALEQGREGSSAVLLEDPDTVSVLELVKEKLSGQMAARLLEGSKEGAVRVCLDNLARWG